MSHLLKKIILCALFLFSACGGAGTESQNPPSPSEIVPISSPCYEIVFELLEGWDLEIYGPGSSKESATFEINSSGGPTAYVARLSETALDTVVDFYYSILDLETTSFEDFFLAQNFESYASSLDSFTEELEEGQGGVFAGVDLTDSSQLFFAIFAGVEDPPGSGTMHVLSLVGRIEGQGQSVEERLNHAVEKFEEEFSVIFDSIEFEPSSCDLESIEGGTK